MDDPRTRLAEALAAGEALAALRWAAAWSQGALAEATAGGPEPAIEAVALLDDALTELSGALRAVPDLVTAAQPGGAVESYLRAREAEVEQVTAELGSLRERAESLRNRLAELAPLRAEVAELRRLERLVTALDELNESRRLISERLAVLKARTAEPENGIATNGAELVRLSREQVALLAPRAREALEELGSAQAELAEVSSRARQAREELAEVASRHAELAAERDQRVAELTAHAAVDRAIAEALTAAPGFDADKPALTQVRAATEEVEQRLAALDEVLAKALKTHDDRHRQASTELPWSG
jgi:chromosome segregation ATPase